MANLKQMARRGNLLTGGHRACVGCGATIIARQVLAATETPVVCSISTGCLEVVSTLYPFNAWLLRTRLPLYQELRHAIGHSRRRVRSTEK